MTSVPSCLVTEQQLPASISSVSFFCSVLAPLSEICFSAMTNQNLMISDPKSGFGMRIRVSLRNSSLLSESRGRYIFVPRRKLLKKLDSDKPISRSNTWLESMRASSPTRVRSAGFTLPTEPDDTDSWISNHPSALSMFEEITNASKGKNIVMFLDYDGTLSPIVEDPERAYMTNEMREAVRDVARYFPTAIVTGRCQDKVRRFVKLPGLYYAGSHGMDIKGPSKNNKYNKTNQAVVFQPASEFLPMIDQVYKSLVEKTKFITGAMVENNKFCVSVHFRCVDEKKWGILADQVRSVITQYPKLRMSHGRKVLEIRPTIKWDKGKALEFLLESLGFANSDDVFPIYIGDDRSDEDAFKVLRERRQGFGVLVSKVPKETHATYSLKEPSEVEEFLRQLVEWKRR